MGVITQRTARQYSGANADKASIPAAAISVNDLYFATDTKACYRWDGAAWAGPVPADWITAAMLQINCVETAKIKDLNVTVGKLAGGITAGKLAADCVETLKIKDLNVTKGKAELGFGRYVPLLKNAVDYDEGDLTTDGTWKVDALDFSGDLPAGATGIVLRVDIRDDAADSWFEIRTDAAYGETKHSMQTQVANIIREGSAVLPISADRLMDYAGKNLVFTVISITCIGYFI